MTPPRRNCAGGAALSLLRDAEELDRKRKRQQARGVPPVYDRAALALTEAERAALDAAGSKPHWRFKLDPEIVRWDDLMRGDSHIDAPRCPTRC